MVKHKSRVFTFLIGILIFLAAFTIIAFEKKVEAKEYAIDWKMSEGKSFQVISGNLGTNTNGSPYTVLSGEQSAFFITYSIMPNNPSDPDLIEADKFAFRIELPGEYKGNLSRVANDNWKLVEGSKDDPNGAVSQGDNPRYFWMISTIDMPITSSDTLTFFMTPFKNGVTEDGKNFPFSVSLINLNNNKNVSGDSGSSFVAKTDKFNWNQASLSVTGGGQTVTRLSTETASDIELANPISFKVSTTPNPSNGDYNTLSTIFGTSFAKSVTFRNTYQLPMGTVDAQCPLIKIDESMFSDIDGAPLPNGVVTLLKDGQGNVTGFTINATVNNTDLTKQFINPTFNFKINGAKINGSCSDLADMAAGSQKTFNITQVSTDHEVSPAVGLNASTTLNSNGNRNITQSGMPNTAFTYKVVNQETPLDSYKDTIKKINSIAGKSTSQMQAPFSAYPDDLIVYEIGAENIKNLNTTNITMVYEEVAGIDFDTSKIIPTQINTGVATVGGKWNITVTYKDGTAPLVKTNQGNNATFGVPNGENVDKITTTIELLPGNEITRGQYSTFKVVNQNDLSKDGIKISNNVNQTFTNEAVSKSSKNSIDFTYKLKPFNKAGLFESDKKGLNLGGATEKTTPKAGDVIEFMVYLKNEQGADYEVDQVIDHYTTGSLSLYNGTTTRTDGGDAIDSKLINSNSEMNLVLWNGDPKSATSSPVAFPGGEPTVTENNGLIDIQFKQNIIVPEGKTYYLTYTMSVKDGYDFTKTPIGNEFNSFRDGLKNGEGMFYWGGPTPAGDGTGNNKWHKNASVPKTITAPWNSAPYSDDVVLYSVLVKNDTDTDWNGEDIVFEDTFTEELQRYDGSSKLNQSCQDCEKLNIGSPYNLAALGNGVGVTVKGPTGSAINVSSSVTNFDPSKVSVIDTNPNDNVFSVNLGAGNVIKSKEQVVLVYTLQVKPDVNPKDETGTKVNQFTNSGVINYQDNIKGTVSDIWNVNANEAVNGIVDLTKSSLNVSNNHALNRLENDDIVTYKVSMSNNHIKANRFIKIQTIMDAMPSNLKYVDDSFKIKFYKTEYNTSNDPNNPTTGTGIKTEMPLPSGVDQYTLTYIDTNSDGKNDTIKVSWPDPIELTSGEYVDSAFQKIQTFSYEFEYDAKVDTTDLPETDGVKTQTNVVQVYTENPANELVKKNGNIFSDSKDLDGNATTKAYVEQSNTVTVINNNFNYGNVVKAVTSNNATFNIANTNVGRDYKITIRNTGARDYTLSKFVDILPIYETYKNGSIKVGSTLLDESKLEKGTFTNASPQTVLSEKITYTDDIVVPANGFIEITYSTVVDKDVIRAEMKKTQNNQIGSLNNSFAFYMKNNANLTLSGGGNTNADDEDNQAGNWDNDKNTKFRYQASTPVAYTDNSIVPGVDITPLLVLDSGKTQQYVQNVTPINPGDSVAWSIRVGNANNSTANILNGSKIIVVLPEGVTFDKSNTNNQYLDSNGTTTKPAWLSEPTVTTNSNNQETIVWTVTQDIAKTNLGFTIKTGTQSYKYTSYAPEVYFVPLQQDNQSFYGNMVNTSGNNLNTAWPGYQDVFGDISKDFSEFTGESHFVKDSTFVDVYGAYGLSAYKKVSDGTNTVTSRDSDRVLMLDSKSDTFKYTLRLEAVKSDTRLSNIVFIDRLPSIGDIAVVTDSKRNSETDVRLKNDGNVKVTYRETNTSALMTLDSSQYDLEYFFGASDDIFTEKDKIGTSQPTRWLSKTDVENDSNLSFSKATAIRVVIIDPSIVIGQMGDMEVTFDAHLGEKTSDYKQSGAVGVNNFGYKLDFGVAQNLLKSEVVSVGVASDVPNAQALITKDIDLNGHTDTKTRNYFESIPENRNFDFTLIGKDSGGVKQYEHDFSINTSTSNAKGYTNSALIEDLDPSLTYTLVEKDNPNFTKDIVVNSEEVNNQIQYTFNVTNTWNPIQLKVDINWLDTEGNEISQADINKLLEKYVSGNVNVDLYNTGNVTINVATGELVAKDYLANESTLSIDQLRIDRETISLNKITAELGYLNQYNKLGSKINYGVNEDSGTFNYDIFAVSSSYLEKTENQQLVGTFTINNQIYGGDVELIKKDDLGNILSNVEFALTDPLGNETTYKTGADGKITLTNLNPGDYSFREVAAPTGYVKDSTVMNFTIEPNASEAIELEAINPIIKGSVKLTKKDDLNNVLKDAEFELYDSNNQKVSTTQTTLADGTFTINNLTPGDYYFKESKAPVGYTLNSNNISFTIEHNPSTIVNVESINPIIRGSVELTTMDSFDKVLSGAQFELYNIENVKIGDVFTTGEDGKIVIDQLLPGNYYLKEIKAPDNYLMMPNEKDREYHFTIDFNPTDIVKVVAYNFLPVELDPPIKKEVQGKDAPDSKFMFEMTGSKDAPMPEGSVNNIKLVETGVGGVEFGIMKFSNIGEYTYELREVPGSQKGFVYDTSKYTMNVKISFNGRSLETTVSYQKDDKPIDINEIIFINKYEVDNKKDKKPIPNTGQNEFTYFVVTTLLGLSMLGYQIRLRYRSN